MWPLLGFVCDGRYYLDAYLPFGLGPAPGIFSTFAEALRFIAMKRMTPGVSCLNYLDDFLFIASSEGAVRAAMDLFRSICASLGVQIKEEKTLGPAQSLVFLGLEIDSVRGELRLPQDKLARALLLLDDLAGKRTCSIRELQSVLGFLNFCARAVKYSRSFLRRMISTLANSMAGGGWTCVLSSDFHLDVAWWRSFLRKWNGVSFFEAFPPLGSEVFTDAANGLVAAYWSGSWWQSQLSSEQARNLSALAPSLDDTIAVKELWAVVLAASCWGHRWTRSHVTFRVDNSAAEAAVNSRVSSCPPMMSLIRELLFHAAVWDFSFSCVRISSRDNVLADALSRNKLSLFFSRAPQASRIPVSVPQLLFPHW
jgi:hypothetical protein